MQNSAVCKTGPRVPRISPSLPGAQGQGRRHSVLSPVSSTLSGSAVSPGPPSPHSLCATCSLSFFPPQPELPDLRAPGAAAGRSCSLCLDCIQTPSPGFPNPLPRPGVPPPSHPPGFSPAAAAVLGLVCHAVHMYCHLCCVGAYRTPDCCAGLLTC